MTLLRPTHIDTARLTYSNGLLVAEASDLPDWSRVWDDACDVGYTLRFCGTEVIYAVEHVERDPREGETLYWDLLPVREHRRHGAPAFRIYND